MLFIRPFELDAKVVDFLVVNFYAVPNDGCFFDWGGAVVACAEKAESNASIRERIAFLRMGLNFTDLQTATDRLASIAKAPRFIQISPSWSSMKWTSSLTSRSGAR